MSVNAPEFVEQTVGSTAPSAAPLRRDAFYISSRGESIFAWLHHLAETSSQRHTSDHGVVICAPIGYEQLHSHRALRHLADAIAATGIPTLRFDWHGTGDSCGIDDEPQRCATWQANLQDAVECLKQETGCRKVSLIGLRLGATIAAMVSSQLSIESLVLWAPVINGRAYAREMMAIDKTSEFRPSPKWPSTGHVEAAGFTLSQATSTELSQWNLLKSPIHCRRVLILGRDDVANDQRLFDTLAAAEIDVEQRQSSGYLEMMAEPHRGKVPDVTIGQIAEWMQSHLGPPMPTTFNIAPASATSATMIYRPEQSDCPQAATRIHERTVDIRGAAKLFGIISEPLTPASETRPTVILLNAGSAYRIGPGRLNVHLARHLSSLGFRCLRLDISGLGDSISADPTQENSTYPSTVFRDVDQVLNFLLAEFGVTECVLMGLCSGAYAAFQSSARLTNPLLVESILINPLTFFWKNGMSLDASPVKELKTQHYYLSSALEPRKWLKLLTGKTNIGVGGALQLLLRRFNRLSPAGQVPGPSERAANAMDSHPAQDDLPADLRTVAAAGRYLTLFFASGDPGYSILMRKAKPAVNQLRRQGQIELTFINDADHTFSRSPARSQLIAAVAEHFQNRYHG